MSQTPQKSPSTTPPTDADKPATTIDFFNDLPSPAGVFKTDIAEEDMTVASSQRHHLNTIYDPSIGAKRRSFHNSQKSREHDFSDNDEPPRRHQQDEEENEDEEEDEYEDDEEEGEEEEEEGEDHDEEEGVENDVENEKDKHHEEDNEKDDFPPMSHFGEDESFMNVKRQDKDILALKSIPPLEASNNTLKFDFGSSPVKKPETEKEKEDAKSKEK